MQDKTLYQNENETQNENMTPPPFQAETEKDNTWKYVTIGGAAAVLVGAGALVGTKALAAKLKDDGAAEDAAAEDGAAREAHVSDDLSFGDAFKAAREEVGPGGVFTWHGGIYNTYTEAEWNAMSGAEKNAFMQGVHAEVPASHVDAHHITAAQPDVHIHVHETHVDQTNLTEPDGPASDEQPTAHHAAHADDVRMVSQPSAQHSILEEDDDVRLLATDTYEEHDAYLYSLDGNDDPDVAIIDVDDNGQLSRPDVLVFKDGTVATVEEIAMAEEQHIEEIMPVSNPAPDPTIDPAFTAADPVDVQPDTYDAGNDAGELMSI